ncbi:MAG: hypothetical protein JO272_03525, partial [Pseudonocardiales bacterium]|nr:hypothetical protein [Pseudonocardiales bacterium]
MIDAATGEPSRAELRPSTPTKAVLTPRLKIPVSGMSRSARNAAQRTALLWGAVSLGHGDTVLLDKLFEDLDRLSPVERLAWSAIQFCCYSIKFFLGVQGQVGAFREVLP